MVDVQTVRVVDSFPYFKESATYDGLDESATYSMAESSYITEDNPMYLGGIELISNDDWAGKFGFCTFNKKNAKESDHFEHHYGEVTPENAAEYVLSYYEDDRNATGYNGDAEDFNWFAFVEEKTNKYKVQLLWSKDVTEIDTFLEAGN